MTHPVEGPARPGSARPPRAGRGRLATAAALLVVVLTAASCSNTRIDLATTTTSVAGADPSKPVVAQHQGSTSLGPLPSQPRPADPHAEPVTVALINQEDVDLGSYPELREGADAAVRFVDEELGGVHGRPIELRPCKANFTPERSQKCAQQAVQEGAVAVLGGLDVMSSSSMPVLEAAGVPYIGGIPVNFDEMRSPGSFQFSGGSPGAFAAFASDAATRLKAKKVSVAYGEYAPIKAAAVDYGVKVLRRKGVSHVTEVPYPVVTSDFAPVVAKAFAGDPDAAIIPVTGKACVDVMKMAARYRGQLYLTGACAAPEMTAAAGPAAQGVIFNVEGPVSADDHSLDNAVYAAAMARYAPHTSAKSAATVAFRAVMNLWSIMSAIPADKLTSASIRHGFTTARDHPSFTGHAFTCDGRQIPDLPSLCSPQQILARWQGTALHQLTDWIDVPAIAKEQG